MFEALGLTAVREQIATRTGEEFYNSLFKAALDKLVSLHDKKVYFPFLYIHIYSVGSGGDDKALARPTS